MNGEEKEQKRRREEKENKNILSISSAGEASHVSKFQLTMIRGRRGGKLTQSKERLIQLFAIRWKREGGKIQIIVAFKVGISLLLLLVSFEISLLI